MTLVPGVSRPSSAAAHWDADALRDVVRDVRDRDARLTRRGAGHRRDRASSSRAKPRAVWPAVHGLGGQDHQLPDRRVCGLRLGHGHAFIDRQLYLPKAWTEDPARMAARHVPEGIGFATKPRSWRSR